MSKGKGYANNISSHPIRSRAGIVGAEDEGTAVQHNYFSYILPYI